MRRLFTVLTAVLVLSVVAQFYFAAVGAFDSAPMDEAFDVHRMLGTIILLLALLATVVAALARVPGRLIGMSGLIAALVLVQSVIQRLADALTDAGDPTTTTSTLVFGLHALNGLAIMGLAGTLTRRARGLSAAPGRGADAAAAPAAGANPAP